MFAIEFWSRGQWNDYGGYKFATKAEAEAFIQRIRVSYRRSGLPGMECRVKEQAAS